MHMLTHRLQILLDEGRYRRIAREATRRRSSVAAVIRDAIDQSLGEPSDAQRIENVRAILAAAEMPVPDSPEDLRRELDDAHARGLA